MTKETNEGSKRRALGALGREKVKVTDLGWRGKEGPPPPPGEVYMAAAILTIRKKLEA